MAEENLQPPAWNTPKPGPILTASVGLRMPKPSKPDTRATTTGTTTKGNTRSTKSIIALNGLADHRLKSSPRDVDVDVTVSPRITPIMWAAVRQRGTVRIRDL